MLLDDAKKLIDEYKYERKSSGCVYRGKHDFTKAEDLFYHVVNDCVEYDRVSLGEISRQDLLQKISDVELEDRQTNLRCLLMFAVAWSMFSIKERLKFTRLFTVGDTSEDIAWESIVNLNEKVVSGIDMGFEYLNGLIGKHTDGINPALDPGYAESQQQLEEFDDDELLEHFETCKFVLAEAKTRLSYMFCTIMSLLLFREQKVHFVCAFK